MSSNPINSDKSTKNQPQKLIVSKQLISDLTNQINDSIALTSQTTKTLQQQLYNLPNLVMQLVLLSTENQTVVTSLEIASVWFDEVTNLKRSESQKLISQLPIAQLNAIEHELLSWLKEHNLENSTEIVQILLQLGLRRQDLEKLSERIVSFDALSKI